LITIGAIAKTYHLLPSEVLARGTTFDIMVMDVMAAWEDYHQKKAEGTYVPDLSEDELLQILEENKVGRRD
jgi:hypothetical protein